MGDQMQFERATAPNPRLKSAAQAGVKTILLHVQYDKELDRMLETGLSLARACGAHLSCLHVTPIEAYSAFDALGGTFVMTDVIEAIREDAKHLGERLNAELANEDVTWDYAEVTGHVPSQILSRAALADLIVAGRHPKHIAFQGSAIGTIGDLLHRSRTPLFLAGDEGKVPDAAGPALIAWNGSREAANAVRAAVGLLRLASSVVVLRVDEEKDEGFPSTRLLEYLSRHGIHAELKVETTPPDADPLDFTYACLLAQAKRMGAYIVMGGYSHSRVSEYMFGGLTRSVLAASPVPIVIAR